MKSDFGKKFRFSKEGVFLFSLPIIWQIYHFVSPRSPFELIVASGIFFTIVPFVVVRFILRDNIYFLGFRRGFFGKGISGILLGWIAFWPILNFLADQTEFRQIYPPFNFMKENAVNLVLAEIFLILPIFFSVQTFLFGYVYEGFRRLMGKKISFVLLGLVGIPLFYWGQLPIEMVLSSLVGFTTLWIRERSKSIIYPILFGWGLSFILDFLIVYKIYAGA